ncbi:MAG: hypothetical protein IJ131_08840 [Eggerthellaceae bacterium]|nr:hypothetical protein [Eggerthellaceae bacterium]
MQEQAGDSGEDANTTSAEEPISHLQGTSFTAEEWMYSVTAELVVPDASMPPDASNVSLNLNERFDLERGRLVWDRYDIPETGIRVVRVYDLSLIGEESSVQPTGQTELLFHTKVKYAKDAEIFLIDKDTNKLTRLETYTNISDGNVFSAMTDQVGIVGFTFIVPPYDEALEEEAANLSDAEDGSDAIENAETANTLRVLKSASGTLAANSAPATTLRGVKAPAV